MAKNSKTAQGRIMDMNQMPLPPGTIDALEAIKEAMHHTCVDGQRLGHNWYPVAVEKTHQRIACLILVAPFQRVWIHLEGGHIEVSGDLRDETEAAELTDSLRKHLNERMPMGCRIQMPRCQCCGK